MEHKDERSDIYYIPPNFIDSGTLMGGMFKIRNVIEAGALAGILALPIFRIPVSLTARIIILCIVVMPVVIFALVGINGKCLSSYLFSWLRFLMNRRIIHELPKPVIIRDEIEKTEGADRKTKEEIRELKRQLRKVKRENKRNRKMDKEESEKRKRSGKARHIPKKDMTIPNYLPIEKIDHGIIYTRDRRFVKIIEVTPVNFWLRNEREQRNIIYSFMSYLKISPVKIQFKAVTKRADVNQYLAGLETDMQQETDPYCKRLQEDYVKLIRQIGSREAITRRFFMIFEYEPFMRSNRNRADEEIEAVSFLRSAAQTARTYLFQCGNTVLTPENENEVTTEILYHLLNRKTEKPMSDKIMEVLGRYVAADQADQLNDIPISEFMTPNEIDFTHSKYVVIDGLYYTFLMIPSGGYNPKVYAGWMSVLVNAGEGIDVDIFVRREEKDRIISKLGQQLRINRSKIKDASDTNTDFDDLEGAIQAGYLLKSGLANNQDFYYINTLITITAESAEELEWRTHEMKKLMMSRDLECQNCQFEEEQAFLSALPLNMIDKRLFEHSKRNVLTTGAASCYPFTSYEMCDDDGILYGVNKHNNSLVIVDNFDSRVYKNANIAILGTSGAGKSYTMQLLALRMRRKHIQVFIIAPLKGHEFRRACKNIGGQFVSISPSSKSCINIMEIRKSDTVNNDLIDGVEEEHSKLATKIQELHIFFSLLIPDMTYEEKQLLDSALVKTYAAKGMNFHNRSLWSKEKQGKYKEMPILGDLYEVLVKDPETKRLANSLNWLVHGSAASFNQQTNVDLDNQYVVLDLSELTGSLMIIGMFIAILFVFGKSKEDRTKKKAIFIDELWRIIGSASNRQTAEYILEVFKTVRGYGGSAVCATQDLNDFFALEDGKYGKGIINACKTKIILNLEDEETQRVQKILKLSDSETMAITHFERGNGLISTNNNNVTVEFKSSQLEKELITTDRAELEQLALRKKVEIDSQNSSVRFNGKQENDNAV
ncbi:TraG/VirB4 family ATPase [Massiliimalia massiliensis]|uniref:TraG/VirB4 family ATPase n=1 Tax=Massiliimalia massiliensis TaxID=1852384 RepID=UPI0009865972|nr:ATP-binding protein [Massiliimalia massiliensis]